MNDYHIRLEYLEYYIAKDIQKKNKTCH